MPEADSFRDLCKTILITDVVSGLWPEILGFSANQSRHSLDTTFFAEVSFH